MSALLAVKPQKVRREGKPTHRLGAAVAGVELGVKRRTARQDRCAWCRLAVLRLLKPAGAA
jgi:hypothetical protein